MNKFIVKRLDQHGNTINETIEAKIFGITGGGQLCFSNNEQWENGSINLIAAYAAGHWISVKQQKETTNNG